MCILPANIHAILLGGKLVFADLRNRMEPETLKMVMVFTMNKRPRRSWVRIEMGSPLFTGHFGNPCIRLVSLHRASQYMPEPRRRHATRLHIQHSTLGATHSEPNVRGSIMNFCDGQPFRCHSLGINSVLCRYLHFYPHLAIPISRAQASAVMSMKTSNRMAIPGRWCGRQSCGRESRKSWSSGTTTSPCLFQC